MSHLQLWKYYMYSSAILGTIQVSDVGSDSRRSGHFKVASEFATSKHTAGRGASA